MTEAIFGQAFKRLFAIGTAVFLLASSAAVLLIEGNKNSQSDELAGRTFQRAVCGLGIGASLRPDWGFNTYDPRVDSADETRLWPVAGGYEYSSDRGMMGND